MKRVASAARMAGLGLVFCCAQLVQAQQRTAAAELSLDSLLNTRISAASKYDQRAAEAPASVTIITADDIRQFGYRHLEEVLEGVRGFYVSNDHNYPYLGTRGFSRPTDYNNRILVLVDGHTLNESVWGGVQIGGNLPINLAAVERIEIVRGPGSVLYGTSAMFAVINLVTKSGTELDGLATSVNLGTMGAREIAVTGGHALGALGSVAGSMLASRTDGQDLYFPEFDAPESANGVVRQLDWEERLSGLGTLTWGGITARTGSIWRAKGIPTGAYDAIFGDDRAKTIDYNIWGEVALEREIRNAYRLTTRLYADRYGYEGDYPYETEIVYTDRGASTSLGAEAMVVWDASSRNRLTFGTEYRRTLSARYTEFYEDGTVYDDDAPYHTVSVFAQNELHLLPRLTLVSGLRLDKMSDVERAMAPRIALIATPDRNTTIKALYGEAFRAPSAAEARLTTSFYERNPSLEPERIRTLELNLQRRVAQPFLLGASLYQYRISDLIDQIEIDTSGTLQFENLAASEGRGFELEVDVVPGGPVSARAAFAWQRTEDRSTKARLTNSPERIGTLSVTGRLTTSLRSAIVVRHESKRLSLDGSSTPDFVRSDLSVGYALPQSLMGDAGRAAELSLRVTNLFDERYYTPGGFEHRQAAIVQSGRALTMRFDWRY